MEQAVVASFAKDLKFEGFLLVRSAEQRASANGSKYLDMTLCDRTGDINAKMWDGTVQPPKNGSIIKVRAVVTEYNWRLQLRVNKLREAEEADQVDMSLLVPCAPYPAPADAGRNHRGHRPDEKRHAAKGAARADSPWPGISWCISPPPSGCTMPNAAVYCTIPPPCSRAHGRCCRYIPGWTPIFCARVLLPMT